MGFFSHEASPVFTLVVSMVIEMTSLDDAEGPHTQPAQVFKSEHYLDLHLERHHMDEAQKRAEAKQGHG